METMAENPKPGMASVCELSVSDNATAEKSDSFVIDVGTFSQGVERDLPSNSRIRLQRSLSRKGTQRASDKISSPRGSSTPGKSMVTVVGPTEHASAAPQVHHQITVTTGNINSQTESKVTSRKSSFKRSASWILDPKKVLLFFATLSAIGSIVLIIFTLTMIKSDPEDVSLD